MINRRTILAAGALSVGTLVAAGGKEAKAAGGGTFVLVHGAFHGGWCWSRVAEPLRAAGHQVFTPSYSGLAERKHLLSPAIELDTFTDDVANVIDAEELNDVILVGHSFGGYPITGVADRMPKRLKHLVYLDAAIPKPNGAPLDELPPAMREQRLKAAVTVNGTQVFTPPPSSTFGVTDPKDIAWVDRRLTPMPLRAYTTPLALKNVVGNNVAKTFIHTTNPAIPQVAGSVKIAKDNGWPYMEMKSGHDIMVTEPKLLVDFLLKLT